MTENIMYILYLIFMDILQLNIHSYKFFHSMAALESSIIYYASLRAY